MTFVENLVCQATSLSQGKNLGFRDVISFAPVTSRHGRYQDINADLGSLLCGSASFWVCHIAQELCSLG